MLQRRDIHAPQRLKHRKQQTPHQRDRLALIPPTGLRESAIQRLQCSDVLPLGEHVVVVHRLRGVYGGDGSHGAPDRVLGVRELEDGAVPEGRGEVAHEGGAADCAEVVEVEFGGFGGGGGGGGVGEDGEGGFGADGGVGDDDELGFLGIGC